MKKFTLLTAAILIANLLFAQYNKIDTSFNSSILGEEKMVDVYLPPGYDENPNIFYPVIYYLHGWTENQNDISDMLYWTQTYINDGVIEPVIMVCADNSPEPFMGSMYTNSTIWGDYEDYMATDLIEWVETTYRCQPYRTHRALLGHSMGGYGAWRLGILQKEKFNVLVASATPFLVITDSSLSYTRTKVLQQNQPGPPFFYDYDNSGSTTRFMFLACGAFAPNENSPQDYINPQILEFLLDENGDYIDTIVDKLRTNSIDQLIKQILPTDSLDLGILFGCGTADISFIEPNEAFLDTIDMLGLPYEYFEHSGGHSMPTAFKQRALVFIDSLLLPPGPHLGLWDQNKIPDSFKAIVYPNPSNGSISISSAFLKEESMIISIIDCQGKLLQQIKAGNQVHQPINIDLRSLNSGIYFITLKTDKGILTKKLIIN